MANGRRGDADGASGGSDWAPLLSDPPSPRAAASDPAARLPPPRCCVMLSDPELSDPAVGPRPCSEAGAPHRVLFWSYAVECVSRSSDAVDFFQKVLGYVVLLRETLLS